MALDDIVKAYDIRGTVPDQWDAHIASALGTAFATFCGVDEILIGHDMRPSGPELVDAFAEGVHVPRHCQHVGVTVRIKAPGGPDPRALRVLLHDAGLAGGQKQLSLE